MRAEGKGDAENILYHSEGEIYGGHFSKGLARLAQRKGAVMDGLVVLSTIGGCLIAWLLLFTAYDYGKVAMKQEIRSYGCEAVVKTWKDKP